MEAMTYAAALINHRDPLLARVAEIVVQRLDDPELSVDRLCREVYVSRSQLHRRLKARTGLSATEFIRKLRLRVACRLLAAPGVNVCSVAMDVGFSDQAYFCRMFKREFGMPPSRMKKQLELEGVFQAPGKNATKIQNL